MLDVKISKYDDPQVFSLSYARKWFSRKSMQVLEHAFRKPLADMRSTMDNWFRKLNRRQLYERKKVYR